MSIFEFIKLEYHVAVPPSGRYTYYPDTTEVPEPSAANTHGRSYKVLAEVDFERDSDGVIFAQGSRFGGHALFVKDAQLYYVYNFLGIPPEQRLVGAAPTAGRHIVGVDFDKQSQGEHGESHGTARLHVDDQTVAEADFRTQSGRFSLTGEGLCIGYDGGDAVSSAYGSRSPFINGRVIKVVFDVGDDTYVDLEREMAAALARD